MKGTKASVVPAGRGVKGPPRRSRLGVTALLALALLLPPTLLMGSAANKASAAAVEFPVAEESGEQKVPAIGGNIVVWEDDRNGSSDIYGKNLATGEPEFVIATDANVKGKPVTNGKVVVWEEKNANGDLDVRGYDIVTAEKFPVASGAGDQRKPAIHGDRVVWEDNRAGGWEIYSLDLASRQESPVATGAGNKTNVSLSDRFVVWQDDRDGGPEVYARDLQTGSEFRVTTGSGSELPAISGAIAVWQSSNEGNFDIYGKDLQTGEEFRVTTDASDQAAPAIDGKIVVWRDGRNGNSDIYGKDLQTGEEFLIAGGGAPQDSPEIDGDTVVWETQRNGATNFGTYDIFGVNLDAAPAAPAGVEAAGSLDGVALKWSANSEADLAGYNVYRRDSADGAYVRLNDTPLTATSYSDAQAPRGAESHYRVTAVDGNGKESAAANSSSAAHALSNLALNAGSASVNSGQSLKLSGKLSAGGNGLAGKPVILLKKLAGPHPWVRAEKQPAPTGADGSFSVAGVQPERSTFYRARFAGEPAAGLRASYSPVRRVNVKMPSAASLQTGHATLVVGQQTVLSGRVISGGQAVAGKRVTLLHRPIGAASYTRVPGQPSAGVLTNANGFYRLAGVKPSKNTLYRARFGGGPEHQLSYSPIRRVNVKAKVITNVNTSISRTTINGRVITARTGSVNVIIRKNGIVVARKVVPLTNSRFQAAYRPPGLGKYTATVSFAKDFDNLGNVSPARAFFARR